MAFLSKIFWAVIMIAIIIVAGFYYFNIPKDIPLIEKEPLQEESTTLQDKIGQMIMLGFRGAEITNDSIIAKTIRDVNIGGVILFDYDVPSKSFPRNIINPDQTKKLIADLQSQSEIPLLVSIDAEGGSVNRLKEAYGFSKILSAKEIGKDTTLKTAQTQSFILSTELKELGFNMDFAPVVDVDANPKNPVIGALNRSFSSDPKMVINNARIFIQNLSENNIIPVEKHFPGHGSSSSDSHLGVVDVTQTYQQKELDPYIQLQKEGLLDVVMTAHIVNKNVDKDYPATLSPAFLQTILRQDIGFQGVIISDDMQMGAIVDRYGFKEAIIKAINAGCDMLLLSNNGSAAYDSQLAYKTANIIYDAVKNGDIAQETIEASYERIINLKKKFKVVHAF